MSDRITLEIAGTSLSLTSGNPEETMKLCERIKQDVEALMEADQRTTATRAALFVALRYLDEARNQNGADALRAQIASYYDEIQAKNAELDEQARLIEQLTREIDRLRTDSLRPLNNI